MRKMLLEFPSLITVNKNLNFAIWNPFSEITCTYYSCILNCKGPWIYKHKDKQQS